MKRNFKFLAVALLGLTIASCNTNNETTANEATVEKCVYSYDNTSSKVGFTAYKFLSKAGVGGAFNEINVTNANEDEDAIHVIEGLNFEIPIASLNTKDAGRDENISKFFFATINTDKILGKVIALNPNGEAILEITLNGITNKVVGQYTFEEDVNFHFNAEIDVNEWNAEKGLTALNTQCKELHTDHANGDKESKLWSEVAIAFSTTLKKECK
ncbi:MAG TPA: YceI family protein [Crocinitomicaceae bacterium]|nr:YceI family protein [Crocinitomicaceae bacterium]